MSRERVILGIKWYTSFIAAAVAMKLIDRALRVTSYQSVYQFLLNISPTPPDERHDYLRARAVGIVVNTAAAHPFVKATCLRRSLALWWMLRWLGVPSEIRFGINIDAGHAWVEHHETVVNDEPDIASRYSVTHTGALMVNNASKVKWS